MREAGRTVYSALRTWQDWEAGKRKMPKSAFALYMILTGQTTVKAAREKFS
jgi:hypothetical protein